RQVRALLGSDAPVTAARIAHALQINHASYGGGLFGKVTLRVDGGPEQPTDAWLAQVSGLYISDAVVASKHQVVDGTLVLLGLAELDPTLAEDLRRQGFLRRLKAEADVLPRTVVSDDTRWASDSPAVDDRLGRAPFAIVL